MSQKIFDHNFGVIFRFEVVRALKRKSFWISLFALPLMFAFIFSIVFLSNSQTNKDLENLKNKKIKFAYIDHSHKVIPQIADAIGGKTLSSESDGINQVKRGQLDAFVVYPKDLAHDSIQIYAKNINLFENSKYEAIATNILSASVNTMVDENLRAVIASKVQSNSHYYREGKVVNPIIDMIAPGIFLVLLYFIMSTFGGQMLTSTVEEKENRITEMLLITVKSRTLIIGKIMSFITLILIQTLLIAGMMIVVYLLARQFITLPNIDLATITLDPTRITIGAAAFIVSILMFGGILVAIGAATPTAKEASQFMTVPMMLLFGPLYIASIAISNPESALITGLLLCPFTAPVLLLLMNTMGNISTPLAIASIAIMTVTTILTFIVAAKIFQTGSVEYEKRFSLAMFRARRKNS